MSGPPPELTPAMPRDEGEPVFREPWEAQSFAIAVALLMVIVGVYDRNQERDAE